MRMWRRSTGRQLSVDFLTYLQEATYQAYGMKPAVYDAAFLDAKVEEMVSVQFPTSTAEERVAVRGELVDLLQERIDQAPSRFEDPLRYATILDLAGEIERAAVTVELPIRSTPLLGTLPLGQVNAMTVLVARSSEHIVLLEAELLTFALLMSKAVARALPPLVPDHSGGERLAPDADGIARRIEADGTVVQRFAQVVLAYALWGRPGQAPQYFIEPEYSIMADQLRDAMELFVIGHEYAHIGRGHLTAAVSRKAPLPATDAEAIAWSWAQEYEADFYGALLALEAVGARGVHPAAGYWGSDLLFSAMDVMERAVALLRHGDEEQSTHGSHPPPRRRQEFLRDSITDYVSGEPSGEEVAVRLLEPGRVVQQTVEALWEQTRPMVLKARARGLQAAKVWLD